MAKLININDKVLECACGTGAISIYIAKKAKRLVATDYSVGMLRQARKNFLPSRMYGWQRQILRS